MLPSKQESEEKTEARTRSRKGSCLQVACFGSFLSDSDTEKNLVTESSGGRKASLFSWTRFRKKKKTVPLDAATSVVSTDKASCDKHVMGMESEAEKGIKKGRKKRRRWKAAEIPAVVEVPGQSLSHKAANKLQLQESLKVHVSESKHPPLLLGAATKSDTRLRPDFPQPEPARTGNSHHGSPDANKTTSSSRGRRKPPETTAASRLSSFKHHQDSDESAGKLDPLVGLSVLVVVVLAVMILGGRVCAIVCTSAWFYFLPWLSSPALETGESSVKKKYSVGIDLNSEENKKRVILEGLLERNGRKPAGFL